MPENTASFDVFEMIAMVVSSFQFEGEISENEYGDEYVDEVKPGEREIEGEECVLPESDAVLDFLTVFDTL